MKPNYWTLLAKLGFAALLCNPFPALAQTLGTATSFAVLGGSAVTNTGSTVVTGDLGVWPNSAVNAITGFPPGIVIGTVHPADAVAQQAQSDVTTAYDALAGLACSTNLTGQDLGGLTLTPGVYCFSSSAQLTGMLTLNAQGNPAAVFVFQIGSTLTTASSSSVLMSNSGSSCNVFWQVGSSATLGTGTVFAGNILALTSITVTTGATIFGRALARNGAVTMDTNSVSNAACGLGPSPTPTLTATAGPLGTATPTATQTLGPGGPPPVVPTLSGWAMIGFGGLLAMVALAMIRRAV
jgi:type VI secretion system secreted protein VgrG